MTKETATKPVGVRVSFFRRWSFRFALLIAPLAVLSLEEIFTSKCCGQREPLGAFRSLALLLSTLPYWIALVGTFRTRSPKHFLEAVRIATFWSCFVGLFPLVYFSTSPTYLLVVVPLFFQGWVFFTARLCRPAAEAALQASGRRSFWQGYGRKLASGFLGVVGALLLLQGILPTPDIRSDHKKARDAMREIHTAQIIYATTYNKGYAAKLEWLAPHENPKKPHVRAAGLISSELVGGDNYGYQFTYTPGPPDEEGNIASDTLTAQPDRYRNGEFPYGSYFIDESRVLRGTDEDRLATAADPAIEW